MVCVGTGQPVYFKQDGQRFGQAQTLKLNVNTDYELRFTTKPGVHIKYVFFIFFIQHFLASIFATSLQLLLLYPK